MTDIVEMDFDGFLAHHGVKGMKWGVTKDYVSTARDAAGAVKSSVGSAGTKTAAAVSTAGRRAGSAAGSAKNAANQSLDSATKAVTKAQRDVNQKRVDHLLKNAGYYQKAINEATAANERAGVPTNPAATYARATRNSVIKTNTKYRDQALADAQAVQQGRLTSTQKKLIVGGVVAGAILGGVLLYQAQESGALASYTQRGQALLPGKSLFKLNPELAKKGMSAADILQKVSKPVNPNYAEPGGQMNCRRATFTHELRRRGYDVQATTAVAGTGQSESGFINAVTPGKKKFIRSESVTGNILKNDIKYETTKGIAKYQEKSAREIAGLEKLRDSSVAARDKRSNPVPKDIIRGLDVGRGKKEDGSVSMYRSSSASVLKALEKQPNGARGEVLFNFGSFGHSMAYEIIDGKAHIFDSQKANLYHAAGKSVESKWDGFNSAEISRLDNVDLDLNFLSRWSESRK